MRPAPLTATFVQLREYDPEAPSTEAESVAVVAYAPAELSYDAS